MLGLSVLRSAWQASWAGTATHSRLPGALWGWISSGAGSPGAPTGQTPLVPPRGQSLPAAASWHLVWLREAGGEAAPLPSRRHPAHPAPHPPAGMAPSSPAASPVWQREEPWLAALTTICTSRLWGRVVAQALCSPRPWGTHTGWWQKAGRGWQPCPPSRVRHRAAPALTRAAQDGLEGCSLGKALCQALLAPPGAQDRWPTQQGANSPHPSTHMDTGSALPGTTPLVAIALMEMAVSIVCRKEQRVSAPSRAPSSLGQRDRRVGRESWGHSRTWGSLGPCRDVPQGWAACGERQMDGRTDGWAGSTNGQQCGGGLSPLEGLAVP